MKKLLILLFLVSFMSCTDNARARQLGGNETVHVPCGQKVFDVTWKGANLWYATEPMEPSYVPKRKTFQ